MNKKRIPIILFAIGIISILIFGTFMLRSFFQNADDKYVSTEKEGNVTRYEWMEMLCKRAGMTEYKSETAYFSDVDANNFYFAYIQSAVEWEVLDVHADFEGNGSVSGQFIALTAMKTMGQNKLQIYLGTEDEITDDTYIKLAIENDLIAKAEMKQTFSREECENILEKYNNLYFGEFWKKDISEIKYQDGVAELPPDAILEHNEDYSKIAVTEQGLSSLSKGNIIIIEQKNTGLKMAKQIIEMNSDGMVTLSDTKLEKAVDSLVVSDITSVSFDDIVNYYRLEESTDTTNWIQSNSSFLHYSVIPTAEVKSKGFKISLVTKEDNHKNRVEVSVTDNDTGITYLLPIQKTIDKASVYQAEVDIDRIDVASQVKYQALTGVEYVDVALDAHATFSGGIQKELDEKKDSNKFLLCKTPVPLGNGLIAVDVEIYLVISADGSLKIEAEIPMKVAVRYEKNKGIRNMANDVSVEKPVIEANCEASTMLRTEPTLIILSCLDVMDAEADVGAVLGAEALLHTNSQLCVDVSASFPVITISVCRDEEKDTLIRKLGLSAEWEIVSSENAPYHVGLHYERLPDNTSQFVDMCTYAETSDKEEEIKEEISTYQTRFGEVEGVTCPVFWFDYPSNWKITKEEVNGGAPDKLFGEEVSLSNDRGVTITYMDFNYSRSMLTEMVNYGRIATNYMVEKVADADFTPMIPNGTDGSDSDYSNLGKFMVAKIKATEEMQMDSDSDFIEIDGRVFYALLPESYVGEHVWVRGAEGYYNEFSFDYPAPYALFAESPDGQFTDEEETDIIAILVSFRDV